MFPYIRYYFADLHVTCTLIKDGSGFTRGFLVRFFTLAGVAGVGTGF